MRIPTSVIVMTLVTAAPFALAVRDTLHAQPKHHAYEDELDVSQEAETARYEAEMQRMEAERQAEEAKKQAVLATVLGDVGQLGPYLDNITVGATRGQADALDERLTNSDSTPVYVTFAYDAHDTVQSITVGTTECPMFREQIRSQWGAGMRWFAPGTHVKATFDESDDCSLTLQRFVEMEQFLDKTTTASIPLGAIGKPASSLFGGAGEVSTPGLLETGSPAIRETTDDVGKIVGLSVTFAAEVEADDAIRARLTALLGKGTQDPDTGEWSWKGKIPVHYSYSDAHVYIDIGEP
jgi:hypothetical protein